MALRVRLNTHARNARRSAWGGQKMQCSDSLRVAVFQGCSVPNDVAANKAQVTEFATEAAGQQCQLCVFPELFLAGYDTGAEALRQHAVPADGPDMQDLQRLATALGIALAVPYAECTADGRLFNACMLIGREGQVKF